MHNTVEPRVKTLIDNFPSLIKNFSYRTGPDLYFYQKTMKLRRKVSVSEFIDDISDKHMDLMYATLACWDMNSRGAKMKYFDDFKQAIQRNKKSFEYLAPFSLDQISDAKFIDIKRIIRTLYDNLHVMESKAKLVSNSKLMHFILPDLVMPMDRKHTLNYFFGDTNETKKRFMTILDFSRTISKNIDLGQFLDEEWNLSIPKVIDNAIICYVNPRYNKTSE